MKGYKSGYGKAIIPPAFLRGGALVCFSFVLIPLLLYGIFNAGSAALAALSVLLFFWRPLLDVLSERWRKIMTTFAAVSALLLLTLTGMMLYAAYGRAPQPAGSAPAIVLGCQVRGDRPSRMLARRLDAAYLYACSHPDALIVVSGGQGTGEQYSESFVMKRYLAERGLDPERVIEENAAKNTGENIRFSAAILRKKQAGDSAVLITDGFHQLRAWYFAGREGLRTRALSSRPPLGMTVIFGVREWMALAKAVLLGR